ncbi:MAG TPA: DUF1579 family protein [Steroidobacter sp.]|uniref:DUF1579 family protein n=1 Tax=Steroidobacter sp. TaxID=1978227 RepID=UPI002EDBB07A
MTDRRDFLTLMAGATALASTGAHAADIQPADKQRAAAGMPAFVRRGLPGPFHAAVRSLQGEWLVDKEIYIAIGSPQAPAKSSGMVAQRFWFAGGRHLHDVTQGALAGSPYYRLGILGFSNIDSRYEWVTFDALNSNMMLYRSSRLDKPAARLDLDGAFTDQGLLGEQFAGKEIPMRTAIDIQNDDRHVIELYFTPPGRGEQLIDRSIYTRM